MAGKQQLGRTPSLLVFALLWVSVGAADVWYGKLTITELYGESSEHCGLILFGKCDLSFSLLVNGQNVLTAASKNDNPYTWSTGKVVGTFNADERVEILAEVRNLT
jgi:hypothetical protein